MRRKLKTAPIEVLTEDTCTHYWLIESPGGRISKGVCKLCGTEKEFYNSWPFFIVDERTVRPSELTDLKNNKTDKKPDEKEEGK